MFKSNIFFKLELTMLQVTVLEQRVRYSCPIGKRLLWVHVTGVHPIKRKRKICFLGAYFNVVCSHCSLSSLNSLSFLFLIVCFRVVRFTLSATATLFTSAPSCLR